MPRYEVPRPKRSDYTHQTFGNKRWFDERAYNGAVAQWETDRDEFNRRNRTSRGGGRGRMRNAALQTGAAALGVGGYMADPGQLPNTGQLDDAHSSQMEQRRDSIEEATRRQGTDTSQS